MQGGLTLRTPVSWLGVTSSMTGQLQKSGMTTRDDLIVQIIDETVENADKYPIAWHVPATSDIVLNATKIKGMDRIKSMSKRELDDYCETRLSGRYGVKTGGSSIDSDHRNEVEKAFARVTGVLAHEAAHSKWSHFILEPWYNECSPQIKAVIDNLDEVRIESLQAEFRDVFRQCMRASSRMLLPSAEEMKELADNKGSVSIPGFAGTAALTLGRADRGILLDFEVKELFHLTEDVVGVDRVASMREIWCDFAEIDDDDAERDMPALAQKWLDLFPEEEEAVELPGLIGMIIAATGAAGEAAEIWNDLEAGADRTPEDMLDATDEAEKVFQKNKSHGYSRGKRGSTSKRPPTAAEKTHSLKLARELEKLQLRARSEVKKTSAAPPGKLHSRAALTMSADRAAGRMTNAKPWSKTIRKHNDSPPLNVGVITDVSGSMKWAEELVASFSYIVTRAVRHVNGKSAAAVFGEVAQPIIGTGDKLEQVTVRKANDGSEAFNSACAAVVGQLRLDDLKNGARILFVVSDGAFVAHGEPEAKEKWVKYLLKTGCIIVWVTDESRDYGWGGQMGVPKGCIYVQADGRGGYSDKLSRKMIEEIKKAYISR